MVLFTEERVAWRARSAPQFLAPHDQVPVQLIVTDTIGTTNLIQTADLTGTGTPGKGLALTPTEAAFSAQAVGTTSDTKTFTLINNDVLTINNILISTNGDFGVSATTCGTSLAPQSERTISVVFTPSTTGTSTGVLRVSDSAANSPQTAKLTGTGTHPDVTLTPGESDFGSQPVGIVSHDRVLTLTIHTAGTNAGLSNIAISATGALYPRRAVAGFQSMCCL